MSKVKLNLSLDEKVVQWLKVTATLEGLTVSELIEEWVRERMDDYGSDGDHAKVKYCVECDRKFTGYGAKCPECQRPPTPEEQERTKQAWERLKAELQQIGLWEE